MDEHQLIRRQEKAARAQAVMEMPGLKEAVQDIEAALVDRIKKEADPHLRDEYWRALQILNEIPSVLGKTIANGKVAKRDIDRLTGHSGQPRAD